MFVNTWQLFSHVAFDLFSSITCHKKSKRQDSRLDLRMAILPEKRCKQSGKSLPTSKLFQLGFLNIQIRFQKPFCLELDWVDCPRDPEECIGFRNLSF